MTQTPESGGGLFRPLTEEEKANVRQLVRYALAIFLAVSVTLVVVALASSALAG